MADELFSRLSAISSIIGGGTATLDSLPSFEEPEPAEHDHAGEAPTKSWSDFNGGTMTEAHGDSHGDTPGARALQDHLLSFFTGGRDSGVYADRDVRGRPGVRSVHGVGRAGDFGIKVGDPLGDQVAAYLVENADRFGIQRIIFNRRSWNRKTRQWVAYGGDNPHTDHVHWEITPEAAARPDLYGGKGGIGSGTATNTPKDTGDLFSRVKSISEIIGGKPAQAAKAARTATGYKDWSTDMASTFARARTGKTATPNVKAGAGTVPIADGQKGVYQQYAISLFGEYGWSQSEASALIDLVQRESGWNPNAANPTSSARGLFQKMVNIHGPLEKTWQDQIRWGLDYIKRRYGTPSAALAHWLAAKPINGRSVGHWY